MGTNVHSSKKAGILPVAKNHLMVKPNYGLEINTKN